MQSQPSVVDQSLQRILAIKSIHKKLKRKAYQKNYKPKPLTQDRLLVKRRRDADRVLKVYRRRKLSGLCERCETKSVVISYSHIGVKLVERRARYCPKHWSGDNLRQEMERVLSSNTAVNTVNRLATHGVKPNASDTSKHS